MKPRRCNQCNRELALDYTKRNCEECLKRRRLGQYRTRESYRRSFQDDAPPRFSIVLNSKNRKLGGIHSTWASPSTCPKTCQLRDGGGCYAELGLMRHHWRNVEKSNLTWERFLDELSNVPRPGKMRHWVAGDFPGEDDSLDLEKVGELARACEGLECFGFTHRMPSDIRAATSALKAAAQSGLHIAVSVDRVEDFRELKAKGIRVAFVVPSSAPRRFGVDGTEVTLCPAQYSEKMTCNPCRLCMSPKRTVAFHAHGTLTNDLDKRLDPLLREQPALRFE